jgi:hypothetical protein
MLRGSGWGGFAEEVVLCEKDFFSCYIRLTRLLFFFAFAQQKKVCDSAKLLKLPASFDFALGSAFSLTYGPSSRSRYIFIYVVPQVHLTTR